MKHWIKKPLHVRFEVVLQGVFNVDILNPFWFYKQKILSEKVSNQIKSKRLIENEYRWFATEFLDIEIEKNQVSFSTTEISNIDLLSDFTISFINILKANLARQFKIQTLPHFKFETKSSLVNAFNIFKNNDILPNADQNLNIVSFIKEISDDNITNKTHTILDYCKKTHLNNAYHINIVQNYFIKNERDLMNNYLTSQLIFDSFDNCIDTINSFYNLMNK